MSMTWQLMESFLKSRAGRRARSGISSPALSMRIATGNVWGRRYVCSSRSAVFTSIMGVSLSRRLRGAYWVVKGRRALPLQWRRDGAIPDHPVARPALAGGGDGRRAHRPHPPLPALPGSDRRHGHAGGRHGERGLPRWLGAGPRDRAPGRRGDGGARGRGRARRRLPGPGNAAHARPTPLGPRRSVRAPAPPAQPDDGGGSEGAVEAPSDKSRPLRLSYNSPANEGRGAAGRVLPVVRGVPRLAAARHRQPPRPDPGRARG